MFVPLRMMNFVPDAAAAGWTAFSGGILSDSFLISHSTQSTWAAAHKSLTLKPHYIMSKGNMLLGFARGSVGDLTFYRRNTQQITRARSRVVKNPKTLAQQMQRAIMRTAVSAYGVVKGICDHSYEGVAYGADSYAKFLKLNLDMLRSLAAAGGENTKSFLPSGFNGLVAMPWVLSKGSISWNGITENIEGLRMSFNGSVPSGTTIDSVTYEQFANILGLRVGDQITLIFAPQRSDIDESSCAEIVVSRVILAPSTGDPAETQMFDAQGRIINANPLNENSSTLIFAITSSHFTVEQLSPDPDMDVIGIACIASRKNSAGSWLRSSASLIFDQSQQEGGYTLRQASMVVSNEIVTPSDWYLNNANEGGASE